MTTTKCKVAQESMDFTDNLPALKLKLEDPSYDVNETCNMGTTALMQAASGDNAKVVELLLDHPDIDPNIRDCEGRTALHYAVLEGNLDFVKLFLSCDKVDPNVPDCMGNRVLNYACWHEEDQEILKFLLHHRSVDKNASGEFVYSSDDEEEEEELGYDTDTAFETACSCSPARVLQWFLDCEDLKIGKKAMFYVCRTGNIEKIKLLLNNPNVDANSTCNGQTPEEVLIENGHEEKTTPE